MRLVEWAEQKLSKDILIQYWDTGTDHEDFNKILNAIDTGGGQTCDVPRVIAELHKAGFRIVKQ